MNRINEIPKIYELMVKSKKHYFNELKPSHLEENLSVVYAITNFKTNQVLYVGKTTRLRRRLYTNHLMGPLVNARLKKYLIDDPEIEHVVDLVTAKQFLKDNCYFQYVVETDMRKRGQLEGLFSFLLDVRYVDKEH
ncbi:MAG: GIY-YIG nuclease family protein [Ruminococcaceae bacterium]|nr:GIY-YIG nuclease family protein [Oscillospiraceae bacterium]